MYINYTDKEILGRKDVGTAFRLVATEKTLEEDKMMSECYRAAGWGMTYKCKKAEMFEGVLGKR